MSKVKITASPDCGNSPRSQFLVDFNIAFAKADVDFIVAHLSEDFTWDMVGDKILEGKETVRQAMEEMREADVREVRIDSAFTHGKFGAANGEMAFASGKRFAFSDVYQFKKTTGTELSRMTSYVLELK